ncbi:hypothetical protein KAR91_61390 [Candidatus Pacearchaeota archaeon]|nr:hypothetical protein [Candidatus Pacearchaeota archaeon]
MFLFWISQYYEGMPPEDDIQYQYVMKTMFERPRYWAWLQERTEFALTL